MRLLIVTQAVDAKDPVLGFFVRWVEEFAKHVDRVEIICLREGTHAFPSHVRVHSLGKEYAAVNRIVYVYRFLSLIRELRGSYDAVFVHMNPEYVILGGLFWRLWGKRIALWYTHKAVNLRLRAAVACADIVFTASKESFRLRTDKLQIMGHGIDTELFSPDPSIARVDSMLSVGRLTKSKRHDLIIRAAAMAGRELRIAGEGPEHRNLDMLAKSLGVRTHFLGGFSQSQLRDEYRRSAALFHASETGSLDKVVLEALATNTPVITTSGAYHDLPVHSVAATPEAIAEAVVHLEKNIDRSTSVRNNHSLERLIPAIIDSLRTPRVIFLFPTSRESIMARIQKGQEADTGLRGLNYIPGARYASIGDYPKESILSRLPRPMQAFFITMRLLRYDYVVAQDNLLLGYLISLYARVFRSRTRWVYVAMNSSVVMRRHAEHIIRRFLLAMFWKSYFCVICISSEQIADFLRLGIPRERLVFIPFGIDARFFERADGREEAYVASVGRDVGRDYKTLFDAAKRVPYQFSVIAGRTNIPVSVSIPENVSVRYDRNYVEVRDLYAHARLVVVASKSASERDGSDCSGQTVILDALAAGKAVIATSLPWITDYFVSGEDLIVVEPGDPDALARAIEALWRDDDKRTRLAASGRKKVLERYTTEHFAKSLCALMRSENHKH